MAKGKGKGLEVTPAGEGAVEQGAGKMTHEKCVEHRPSVRKGVGGGRRVSAMKTSVLADGERGSAAASHVIGAPFERPCGAMSRVRCWWK